MRHATLRQMQVFDAVARHLSFSKAARELHLTQPAVSMQIKQLEGLAGLPLFEQVGRVLYLTAAGTSLLDHARAILGAVADAEEAMAALRGQRTGGFRIGVVSTAKYFAPSLLSAFTAGYPGIEVSLQVANRRQILADLAENRVDLALMGRPPTDMKVNDVVFAAHPHAVIAAPTHPLARKRASLSALDGETLLVREQGSGTRALMERLLAEHGVTPGRLIEMASNETIKQAVMAGMGVSFLSVHTIGLEVSVGRLLVLDMEDTPVERQWHVVWREGKRLLPIADAFVGFMKDNGERLIEEAVHPAPTGRRTAKA
ncbi:RuBisCO operon transcriptional regulator CbbR [Caenispirillum salinarum AK4]|uniref:HTH-type transcriptional regulator CbbR n=1 Tax=Caenispirillum salinarum AK4 TaxID=1238182 RepID=K9HEA2_9PROT|nr:LysR family transcriptional regulator [Caenispirillum salinarum]EKV27021.1 RuBisCO operon transcriptional regulator CbbR [Caenispirillum salinarum AK4]